MSVIASTSRDVKFHDWSDGNLLQTYLPSNHEGCVQSISWSKDGSWVVLVPSSGPTELISIKDNNLKLLQTIHDVYRPSCASFHTTTKKLIGIGTVCGQVMIYDIKGKNIKKHFPRVTSKICSLHYNNKDSHIAAVCNNGDILLLSNLVNNISAIYKVPDSNAVSSANFHTIKRNLFAAGSDFGIVAAWDINTNRMLGNIQAHQAPVTSLVFSPLSTSLLVTGGLDRKFAFYDTFTLKSIRNVEVSNAITSLDFSYCGIYLGVGFQNGKIAVYDIRANPNNPLKVFEAHQGAATRNLLFQKVLTNQSENNSVVEVSAEVLPYEQLQEDDTNTIDIIDVECMDDSGIPAAVALPSPRNQFVDSFLQGIGLDDTNQSQSPGVYSTVSNTTNENIKRRDSTKHITFHKSGNVNLTLPKTASIKISSTPKFFNDADITDAVESPILPTNQTYPKFEEVQNAIAPGIATDDLRGMIRDIVRQEVQSIVHQEVKTQIDALKDSIQTEFTGVLCHMRRYFLDLQMSVIKEFVNMETLLEKQMPTPSEYVDYILNQNNMLPQQLVLKDNVNERGESHPNKF